jgi:acetylornithine/N-succinyldiaminopimelate aminotransferase
MDHILKCHPLARANFIRGQNCHLWDDQGRRYVDLESGSWAVALGHAPPRLGETMKAQIDRIIHLGTRYPNHLAEQAALDVLDIVGLGGGKCVFLSSGSEAVEFAVQAVRRVTGRPLLLTFSDAYLAAFGSAGHKSAGEWHLLDWHSGAQIAPDEVLREVPFERIGGFVLEPGGGGPGFVRFPPAPLVQEIVRRVRAHGGFFVANEITTGMGRTGRWFGHQHYDVQPDLVALGKGLGNGYPVSAVAMRPDVAERLEASGLHYAQSHQNDPLGCAVASEVIAIFREENWIERGASAGGSFLAGLARLREKHGVVKDARGRGLLLALELHPDGTHSGGTLHQALFERGFLAGCYPVGHPAGTGLRFDPSLTIEDADIVAVLECLDAVLSAAP